jgi:predicted nucleotidyltransferase
MIDPTAYPRIQALLHRIESEHAIRILYACESGSRAWGFASPDSDFDIRFLYVRTEADYLAVETPPDTIELPLEDDLDAAGWDVRKALGLLARSNGPLLEWLHSPIVYQECAGFVTRWRNAARDVFSPRHCADHYRGLARGMIEGKLNGKSARAKDYLYALRAILAADWVCTRHDIAPVPFAELVPTAPAETRDLIPSLMEHKANTREKERIARIAPLDAFLRQRIQRLSEEVPALPYAKPDRPSLDPLLRREIRHNLPEKAADYTLDRVRRHDTLLFESVAGSHAYGTAIDGSDQDLRGVFLATRALRDGLDTIEQVADERGDTVYYEIGRFIDLLLKNNPNALELLAMPQDCIRFRHPLFEQLTPGLFLSKLCARTFGEYAMGQIRKARGLNKKIVNPEPEQRRPLLDFCHVPDGQGSLPLRDWLAARHIAAESCGLTAVTRAPGLFAIYHNCSPDLRGIVSPKDHDSLVFSRVPLHAKPIAWMHCNLDAFKAHCRAHREYWQWVAERNEERYATNAAHGRGYDSKNLMHTIRLLEMAGEIADEGRLRVRRPNRDFLLEIRSGRHSYEELVAHAESLHAGLTDRFARSPLPEAPDRATINALLVEMRASFR